MSGPAPETTELQTLIESRDQLVAYLEAGSKPREEWRIGTEHEKFAFLTDTLKPVPYDGPRSIKALLEGLRDRFAWNPIIENANIIGLIEPETGGSISLEPGGQFELSGAPLKTVQDTCLEVHEHLAQVREVGDALGIGFLGLGFSPLWTRDETPTMPKGRYRIMKELHGQEGQARPRHDAALLHRAGEPRLLRRGRHGEKDAGIAGPAARRHGAVCRLALHRGQAQRLSVVPLGDLARHRSRPHRHAALCLRGRHRLCERYVDYALDVPMYFVYRDGTYHNVAGESFRAFMNGKLPQLPGLVPTLRDWGDHLTTIFPEVRLKRYMEMRGADFGPWRRLCALPALWVGLLYDDAALDAAWDLVKGWSAAERQALRDAVPRQALGATIAGRTVRDVARDVLAIAREGLEARHCLGCHDRSEAHFLEALDEIVASGRTNAEDLLALYRGDWHGDIARVFRDFAF